MLTELVKNHSQADHETKYLEHEGNPVLLEYGSIIEVFQSEYDSAEVLNLCIEHVLLPAAPGKKDDAVDFVGHDGLHEKLVLDGLRLNHQDYLFNSKTKTVYLKTVDEEGNETVTVAGKMASSLWIPRQLRYTDTVQLALVDDNDPGLPHLYKIVSDHPDIYTGETSSEFLGDVTLLAGEH